jgi:hypothetical protein
MVCAVHGTGTVEGGTGEVGDYHTDGERGTACRACRFVDITGAASVRFDASITTEVAWFTGIRQVTIEVLECARGFTARSSYRVVELVQTYRTFQCGGHSGRGVE